MRVMWISAYPRRGRLARSSRGRMWEASGWRPSASAAARARTGRRPSGHPGRGREAVRQLGSLAEDAHRVHPHLARSSRAAASRVESSSSRRFETQRACTLLGGLELVASNSSSASQRSGILRVRPVDHLIGGQDPDGQVGMARFLIRSVSAALVRSTCPGRFGFAASGPR